MFLFSNCVLIALTWNVSIHCNHAELSAMHVYATQNAFPKS